MAEKFPNNSQSFPSRTGGDVDNLVTEVKEQLETAWRWDRENRRDAHEDLKFLAGDQWPQTVRQKRQAENRPVITINKLPPLVNQVVNDIRQNPATIKTIPAGEGSDMGQLSKARQEHQTNLANVYTGLMRQIQYQSSASAVYAKGGEHAISCGIGHWRIDTEFVEDSVFDQEILIKRIPNPLNVYYDPAGTEPTRKDGNWTVVTELIPIEDFRTQWPGAKEVDTQIHDDNVHEGGLFWRIQESIRIAEYWRKVPEKRKLMAFQDPETGVISTLDVTDIENEELMFLPEPIGDREVDGHRIEQFIVSGSEVLEGPDPWAGRWIPIIPVVGSEVPLQTKTIRFGLVRFMRDPQQLYNYFRSAAAESIALAPKSPWVVTPEMIGSYKKQWDTANTENRPYLLYKPDKNAPNAKPERTSPPESPVALWNEQALATDDLKATSGIFDASQGAQGNETSGVAIRARQLEGDNSNFHFADNLKLSMEHTGVVLVDLIPRIYDSQRIVAILGEDDSQDLVPINAAVMDEDGEPLIVNNLSDGRFNVRVTTGPSYTTKRVEAVESMIAFAQAVPGAAEIIADLIAKNQDWPGAEEISERLKRAMPAELTEDEDDEEQQPDPQAEAMNQLLIRGQEAQVAQQEAQAAKTAAEAEKTQFDAEKVQVDTEKTFTEIEKLRADIAQIAAAVGLTEAQTDKTEAETVQTGANTVKTQVETEGGALQNVSGVAGRQTQQA